VGRDNVRASVQPFHPPQKSQKPHKEFIKLQFASDGGIPSESTGAQFISAMPKPTEHSWPWGSVPFGYRRCI
jgi:hypothetical protein